VITCGTYDNVVRFIPPLVVNDDQIHTAVGIFRQALV
jgi:4-aminobutyrate aminotransferase